MNTIAHTALGDLRGTVEADGTLAFRGVPYAAPPLGDLRFASPVAVAPWQGVRDATRHGAIAPQMPSRLRVAMGDFDRPQSEDCLSISIATPALDGARPVIVWLHGGAYISGAGSLDWYDGLRLAREADAVVVGVNYRLGALGFLHHPAIGGGNCALEDMTLALRWVGTHIAGFGGDAGCVTVMGQSAGAHAVMCLLAMGTARGLFHRAILLSNPGSLAPMAGTAATGYAEQLLAALDIASDAPDVAARLRAMPVERMLAAQGTVVRSAVRFADVSPPFVPVIDGLAERSAFINAAVRQAAAQGVAIVLGTTREEMHAFFAADPAMAEPEPGLVAARFAALAGSADAIAEYRRRRPGGSVTDLLGDLVTDHMFLSPAIDFAEAVDAAGGRAWLYQFDWSAPGTRFRACHCIELPFVFGNAAAWRRAAMLAEADPLEITELGSTMRAALAAFARGGDPSIADLPWPPYRRDARLTMRFGAITGVAGDPAGAARRTASRA